MFYCVGQHLIARGLRWVVSDHDGGEVLDLAGAEPANRGMKIKVLASVDRPEIPGVREAEWPGEGCFSLPVEWRAFHEAFVIGNPDARGLDAFFGRVRREPYQLEPLRRIRRLPEPRLLIADDAGMGKTVEAGIILSDFMARGLCQRLLVVAPRGLVGHWRSKLLAMFGIETEEFCLRTVSELARRLPSYVNPWMHASRIVTSMDFAKKPGVLRSLSRAFWDAVVFDECHHAAMRGGRKNQRHRLLKTLSGRCRCILLLSATPHDGTFTGFSSLVECLDPLIASGDGIADQDSARQFVIRRLRKDVGIREDCSLRRVVSEIRIEMGGEERTLYSMLDAYSRTAAEIAGQNGGEEARSCMELAEIILRKRFASSLHAFTRTLRARISAIEKRLAGGTGDTCACLLPGIKPVERIPASIGERHLKAELEALVAMQEKAEAISPESESKTAALAAKLREIRAANPAEKVVVFTEFRDTLMHLARGLGIETRPDAVELFHGGMPQQARDSALRRFLKSDWINLMIATDAAGEGIDIQDGCRILIHNELPWNPNRMEQRNGRVDRYGQKGRPEIFYFRLAGSIESEVLSALYSKLDAIRNELGSISDVLGSVDAGKIGEIIARGGPGRELLKQGVIPGCAGNFSMDRFRDPDADHGFIGGRSRDSDEWGAGRFVLAALEVFGGSASPAGPDSVFSIRTPDGFARRCAGGGGAWLIAPEYPEATFDREIGLSKVSSGPEFIHEGHPLAAALASRLRERRFNESFRGCSTAVSGVSGKGVLFTFLLTAAVRGGARAVDRLACVLGRSDGSVSTENPRAVLESIDGPLHRPSRDELVEARRIFNLTRGKAREMAAARALELAEELRKDLNRRAAARLGDLGQYREARAAQLARRFSPGAEKDLFSAAESESSGMRLKEEMRRLEAQVIDAAEAAEAEASSEVDSHAAALGICVFT